MKCNTNLGSFCAEHDNWEELLSADPFNLKIKKEDKYIMFVYDQIRSDFNLQIVREARGIIFRNNEWENPVCWAFNKFGNYGESYVPTIDWSTAFVAEKIDGSLIKLWHDKEWHISTNGTGNAFKAKIHGIKVSNFGEYFCKALEKYCDTFVDFLDSLNPDLTYMFELVGPYNRVVIPYSEPDIYFLGARNKYTGTEFNCSEQIAHSLGLGNFNVPKVYKLNSLSNCIKAVEKFNWDQEGFVVSDDSFNRVKVKSPSYVLAHYTRNNNVITRRHLIKVIINNEIEEFLCYASDYKEDLQEVQKLVNSFINIGNNLAKACRAIANKLDKEDYARLVKALPKLYQGLLFCNYYKEFTMQELTKEWHINKWEDHLARFEKLKAQYSFGGD